MAFLHGKSTTVVYNATNLSSFLNQAATQRSVEVSETTAFGKTAKTYITGLKDGTVSCQGMFDGSAAAIDPIIAASLAVEDGVLTVVQGGTTVGNRASLAKVDTTSYEVSSPVGDVVSASADFQCDGGIDDGVNLSAFTSVTATGNQTSVDGVSSTTNGGVAHLHVTVNTHDNNTVVKVQHSADNSTWADLVTFTTVATTVTTQERVEVAAGTTVNRYLRATHTLSGSSGGVTYLASFARR